MVAYLTRMPAGIPGEVNRVENAVIEPLGITPFGTSGHPTAFGIPIVVDATTGNGRAVTTTDDAGHIYGLLVRPFPAFSSQDALGVSTPPTEGPIDVLRFGYMTVKLSGSTAAVKGAQVYVWKSAAASTHIQGGFEATDPSTDGFAISATFMGPADASGNVEIQIDCMHRLTAT